MSLIDSGERMRDMPIVLPSETDRPEINMLKEVDKTDAVVGDILTYSITLSNDSLIEAERAVFKDLLPEEVEFVSGSMTIDDEPFTSADPNTGISLEYVSIEGPIVITFKVTVVKPHPSGVIGNTATLEYEYHSDPSSPPSRGETVSNEVQTHVPAGRTACEWSRDFIIHSIGQEEKALADVLFMEGEKIQAAVQAFQAGIVTVADLLAFNQSATTAVQQIAQLEKELIQKLDQAKEMCCGCE